MEKKKLVTTVTAVALLGALAVGGTLAYLTDTETKTNNFNIATDVDIELTEDNWDPDEDPDPNDPTDAGTKNTAPNAIIAKDPVVKNNGDEKIIAFVEVKSPKATITTEAGGTASKQELFFFGSGEGTKLTANAFNTTNGDNNGKNWILLNTDTASDDDNVIYRFGYNTIVDVSSSTESVFDFVFLKNYVNSDTNPDAAKIVVTAYAIQADNLYTTDDSAIDTSTLDASTLGDIYETYKDDVTPVTSTPAPDPVTEP